MTHADGDGDGDQLDVVEMIRKISQIPSLP
jgi:hypothetical protein